MSYEQKFIALRKRLDQLGYRQTLGIESLPLVERLFSDLLHTTNSLKNAKVQELKSAKHYEKGDSPDIIEDAVEPYRADNAKLVQENNKLHLELVKIKDELNALSKSTKLSLRKLEHENADLRFLNSQYVLKVRAIEKESSLKTETIHKLQEKNLQAIIQTPGGRKKSIPFRRQRMNIESTLPPAERTHFVSTQPDDPYIADLVQVADKKINKLSEDLKMVKCSEEVNINKISCLHKQYLLLRGSSEMGIIISRLFGKNKDEDEDQGDQGEDQDEDQRSVREERPKLAEGRSSSDDLKTLKEEEEEEEVSAKSVHPKVQKKIKRCKDQINLKESHERVASWVISCPIPDAKKKRKLRRRRRRKREPEVRGIVVYKDGLCEKIRMLNSGS